MTSKPKRRSLKDCLKTILQSRRDNDHEATIATSAVLQRRNPSLALLPSFSSVSLLCKYHIPSDIRGRGTAPVRKETVPISQPVPRSASHGVVIRNHVPFSDRGFSEAYQAQAQLSELAGLTNSVTPPAWQPRPQDALPCRQQSTPSSTEFARLEDVAQIFTTRPIGVGAPLTRFAETCNVPDIYRQGVSQQASLATITSLAPSVSTLRLQPSANTIHPLPSMQPALRPDSAGSNQTFRNPMISHSGRHSRASSAFPRTISSLSVFSTDSSCTTASAVSRSRPCPEVEAGLACINHFASFAVLDASEPTCPIVSLSADLRDVLSIGDQFCLDPKGVEDATMDTITGLDADGNEVVHLLLYSPLLKPNSGRNRFVLASFLDVTEFIKDTATLPELDFASDGSIIEEDIRTPRRSESIKSPTYELVPEDLLGGCFVPERKPETPIRSEKHDIWLDIASEESRRARYQAPSRGASTPRSSTSFPSSTLSVQNILDQFLLSLQEIYADFFVLGTTPFDKCAYEICNVSPRVYASRTFIEGHLSKTPASDKASLEKKLAQEDSFNMAIRWGRTGEMKQLYCVPLFGQMTVTWACFLVDGDRWASILPRW